MTMMLIVSGVLVMMVAVGAGDCPSTCACSERTRDPEEPGVVFTAVTCSADPQVNATALPGNMESLILINTTVDLEGLLDELCIAHDLPYFTRLILAGIVLPNVCNVSVSGLERLASLVITGCGMQCVPRFNLSTLQDLDLSNNELSAIEDDQFRTLFSLEVLNLSVNALQAVKSRGFSGLTGLKCLDLSRNNLNILEDYVLVPLSGLQHLNLSNNKLEVLDEACFSSLLHLQQLDVSWNRLARVAPGSLQLPSLARLLLAGNPKLGGSHEPALFVGTGRRLQTVDASRTGLKQVPAALTHSIRTLRLAGNSILVVSCGDLDSYPLLQLLDFTSNKLADIEEDALGRLDSLTILYLNENRLRSIPHSLPERLRVLHLEHNKIEAVQASDLQGLTQLEVLLLAGNRIKVVKEAAFSQLTALTSLDLSHNPITELPTGSLAGPIQLRVLRLAGLNVISPARATSFPLPTPEHLITLDLSRSPGLARQMLADTAALAAARELQELDVSASGLNYIRSDLLHFLPQLRVLRLHDNPLNCSHLLWLTEWMRRQDEPEYRKVLCASPPDLWGTLLVDLQSIEPGTAESIINHVGRNESNSSNNSTYAPQAKIPVGSDNRTAPPMSDDEVSTLAPKPLEITTQSAQNTTNKTDTSTEINYKHEMTTRFIVGYRPAKTINIFKSSIKKINEVLKDVEDVPVEYYAKKPHHVDHENATTVSAEMSMYSGDSRKPFAHPGMLILAGGVLGAVAVLVTLTTRMHRRNRRLPDHEDIEVSSLPSVTELW